MQNSKSDLSFLFASLLFLPEIDKHLYLDPGSGSLILQIIIAAIAGFGYVMRDKIGRFFNMFKKKKAEEETETKSDDAE